MLSSSFIFEKVGMNPKIENLYFVMFSNSEIQTFLLEGVNKKLTKASKTEPLLQTQFPQINQTV